jgi:hypothetical protein
MNQRFKAEVGVQNYTARTQMWYIISGNEREDVVADGKPMIEIGDSLFSSSADWRHSRAHAVRDVIAKIEEIRDALSRQIDEIKKSEGVL